MWLLKELVHFKNRYNAGSFNADSARPSLVEWVNNSNFISGLSYQSNHTLVFRIYLLTCLNWFQIVVSTFDFSVLLKYLLVLMKLRFCLFANWITLGKLLLDIRINCSTLRSLLKV